MHAIQGGMDSRGKPMVIAGAGIMDVLRMVLICMYIGNWHSLINFNGMHAPADQRTRIRPMPLNGSDCDQSDVPQDVALKVQLRSIVAMI